MDLDVGLKKNKSLPIAITSQVAVGIRHAHQGRFCRHQVSMEFRHKWNYFPGDAASERRLNEKYTSMMQTTENSMLA
jgi:hypothetical protein